MSLFGSKLRLSKCQWVLILILVSSPLYTMTVGSFNLYFIYMLLFFVAFLYSIKNGKKIAMRPSSKVLLVMLLFGLMFDMFLAEDPVQSNKVLILTFLILLYPTNSDTARIIYPILAITGVAFGLYMVSNPQHIAEVRLTVQVGDWVMDPNWAAMALFSPFCYGLSLFEKSTFSKLLGVLLFIIAIYVTFMTGSRGAMVSLAVASLTFIFLKMRLNFSTVLLITFICIIAYFSYTYFIPTVDQDLIDRYNGTVGDTNRSHAWGGVLAGFMKSDLLSMIFGHGSGSTVSNLGFAAHNIFLEQLYVRGILGVILIIIFIFQFLRETLTCRNYIGFYLFAALVTCSLFTPAWGGVYMMMPLAAVGYMNNFYYKYPNNERTNENRHFIHLHR